MVVVWFCPVHWLPRIKNKNNLLVLFLVEGVSSVKQQAQNFTVGISYELTGLILTLIRPVFTYMTQGRPNKHARSPWYHQSHPLTIQI